MINEEWNKTQNDAPFVAFYDMCAVTFVLPDEKGRCVDLGTAIVHSYIPINPHGVSQANWFPFQTLLTSRKKCRIWNKNFPAYCNPTNYGESSSLSLILVAFYDMPFRKAEVLFYTVKKKQPGTPWGINILIEGHLMFGCIFELHVADLWQWILK